MEINAYSVWGVITCVTVASATDLLQRRIPNWLTFPSMALGTGLNWWLYRSDGLVASLEGLLAGFLLLFVVYLLGGMGAGDVKLLSAVGAFLGPRMVFYSFIWMALAGGLVAVLAIVYKKALRQTANNLRMIFSNWALGLSNSEANLTIKNQSLIRLPYGTAIAAGTLLALWFKRIPGFGF